MQTRSPIINLTEHIISLADTLDAEGLEKCSNVIDERLIKTDSLNKIAQYVGAIGYVLKQQRAMSNCIRKKRVASSAPMQELIFECLKEYQDGQAYFDTEWHSKYASCFKQADNIKVAAYRFLKNLKESSAMDTHIQNLKDVVASLKANGKEDKLLNQVLSHVSILEGAVGGGSKLPFKIAAPESQRSWWKRILSPSQKHWWMPESWTTRGEDEDARLEVQNVLEALSGLKTLCNQAARATDMTAYQELEQQAQQQVQSLEYNMELLGQRAPIIGRRNIQPMQGVQSPSKVYMELDNVMSRIYQNPLDLNTVREALQLTYDLNYSLNDLQTEPRQQQADQADQTAPEAQPEVTGVVGDSGSPTPEGPAPVGPEVVNDAVEQIISDGVDPARAASLLTNIQNFDQGTIKQIIDGLTERARGGGVREEPEHGAVPPAGPAGPAGPSGPARPRPREEGSPDLSGEEFPEPMLMANSRFYDLMKIADALDKVSPEIADIIDKYVDDHVKSKKEIRLELPSFPQIASILKEKAPEEKT